MGHLDKARGSRSAEQIAAEERYTIIDKYTPPRPPSGLPHEIREIYFHYILTAPDYILTNVDIPQLIELCYVTHRLNKLTRELYEDPTLSFERGSQGQEIISPKEQLHTKLLVAQDRLLSSLRINPKQRLSSTTLASAEAQYRREARQRDEHERRHEPEPVEHEPDIGQMLLGGRRS